MAACIIGRKRWGYTPWSGVEAFKGETSFLSAGLEADRHDVEHSKGSSIHWCSVSLSAQRVLPVTVGRQCSARLAGSPAACTDNRSKKRAKSSMNDYPMSPSKTCTTNDEDLVGEKVKGGTPNQ
jgi:hypothetical protein